MRLKIENFAKVKRAEIVVDGITVIAGENNTGKSTYAVKTKILEYINK